MYKNVKEMKIEELQSVAELVIALDKLQETESPEQVLELVTALQTIIRNPEAVVVEEAEEVAEETAEASAEEAVEVVEEVEAPAEEADAEMDS